MIEEPVGTVAMVEDRIAVCIGKSDGARRWQWMNGDWTAIPISRPLVLGHVRDFPPDGPQESAGPSGGRTGPLRRLRCRCGKDAGHTDAPRDGRLCGEPDPTCGHRLGVMRCQLRRGHAGDHEDYSAVAQERRA